MLQQQEILQTQLTGYAMCYENDVLDSGNRIDQVQQKINENLEKKYASSKVSWI